MSDKIQKAAQKVVEVWNKNQASIAWCELDLRIGDLESALASQPAQDHIVDAAEMVERVADDGKTIFESTPRDEWPDDAALACGHLAGMCFGLFPSDEIGHCVGLITEALDSIEQSARVAGEPVAYLKEWSDGCCDRRALSFFDKSDLDIEHKTKASPLYAGPQRDADALDAKRYRSLFDGMRRAVRAVKFRGIDDPTVISKAESDRLIDEAIRARGQSK